MGKRSFAVTTITDLEVVLVQSEDVEPSGNGLTDECIVTISVRDRLPSLGVGRLLAGAEGTRGGGSLPRVTNRTIVYLITQTGGSFSNWAGRHDER